MWRQIDLVTYNPTDLHLNNSPKKKKKEFFFRRIIQTTCLLITIINSFDPHQNAALPSIHLQFAHTLDKSTNSSYHSVVPCAPRRLWQLLLVSRVDFPVSEINQFKTDVKINREEGLSKEKY